MISSQDVQNAYVEMYTQMRNYIWPVETVELLAELEIAVYDAFQDVAKVTNIFNGLDKEIRIAYADDEEFTESVDKLRDVISDTDSRYYRLYQVTEVLPDENKEADSVNDNMQA